MNTLIPHRLPSILLAAWALGLCAPAPAVRAYEFGENVRLYGHAQLWFTLYEQMEEASELFQNPSGDEAATSTTGFSLYRARLGAEAFFFERLLQFNLQMRLEKTPGILDVYLGFHFRPWLKLYFGQFKVPAPRETLTTSRELDFILRPAISEFLVDYSLSRTTYPSSLFYGVHSYLRDFGIGLKGDLDVGFGTLGYFLMLGNGLGANLFIGGAVKREYILTNTGQFFSGLRIDYTDPYGWVTAGGHLNYNWHDNLVFNSGRVVIDLKRISYSGDISIRVPGTGIRLGGIYGEGEIRDDYDDDGRTDLNYSGWACSLMWRLNEVASHVLPSPFWEHHTFEVGARFESMVSDWNETGDRVFRDLWTFGINYLFRDMVKVQLNYIHKKIEDPSLPDLDDDVLLLSVQGAL